MIELYMYFKLLDKIFNYRSSRHILTFSYHGHFYMSCVHSFCLINKMMFLFDSEPDMGWMYKGDKPETEEYLLGRRIDRHIEGESEPQENTGK